jgi:hypothetical protein
MSNIKLLTVVGKINDASLPRLLKDLTSLEIKDERSISIIGWDFDIPCTIYSYATANEVKSGLDFLLAKDLPIKTYFEAFLIKSIDDIRERKEPEKFGDMITDPILEPEI